MMDTQLTKRVIIYTIYTLSTHYLHTIYTLSTHYLTRAQLHDGHTAHQAGEWLSGPGDLSSVVMMMYTELGYVRCKMCVSSGVGWLVRRRRCWPGVKLNY